jgi:hypothetical protein
MTTPIALENMLENNGPINTWEQMATAIALMSPEQKKTNITIELEYQDEFYPAELRICGSEHSVLDDGHPVIFTKEA